MKQEEKNLLIGVLTVGLPYGIKVQVCNITDYTPVLKGIIGDEIFVQFDYARPIKNGDSTYNIIKDKVKPYLRPLPSMTEEEVRKVVELLCVYNSEEVLSVSVKQDHISVEIDDGVAGSDTYTIWFNEIVTSIELFDWVNEHHFDYRGLIEKGLALEAPEGMYNTK